MSKIAAKITLALGLLAILGCQGPMQQAYVLHSSFNTVNSSATQLHKDGYISDDALIAINETSHAVWPYIIQVDNAAIQAEAQGGSIFSNTDWKKVYDTALQQLQTLADQLAKAQEAGGTKGKQALVVPKKAA